MGLTFSNHLIQYAETSFIAAVYNSVNSLLFMELCIIGSLSNSCVSGCSCTVV